MDETAKEPRGLEERLAKHAGLREQVERLLQEVDNDVGQLNTADEAEEALVERMRQLGREALRSWAEQRQQALSALKGLGERQGGKKNCAG